MLTLCYHDNYCIVKLIIIMVVVCTYVPSLYYIIWMVQTILYKSYIFYKQYYTARLWKCTTVVPRVIFPTKD